MSITPLQQNRKTFIEKIFAKQDRYGRFAYDPKIKKYSPGYEHYLPKYSSTLWTLILLADLKCNPKEKRAHKALNLILKDMYRPKRGVFGWSEDPYGSHEPSPCLNGNILYLYFYFGKRLNKKIENIISFFHKYQRFDDGDFKTQNEFPYCGQRDCCYSSHTCYWGVTKIFKGLSFIPLQERTLKSHELMRKCIDFILLHNVCYSSHKKNKLLHHMIERLTFPDMYRTNFLEILWLLMRESVNDKRMKKALKLLKSKQNKDGSWNLEQPVANLIVPVGKKNKPNPFITERAKEVLEYYKAPRV